MQPPSFIPHPARDFIARSGHTPLVIVVHATAGTNSLGWLSGNPTGTSIHILIAKDGTAWRLVDDAHGANHCGRSKIALGGQTYIGLHCNEITLGIELENSNSGRDPYPAAQLQKCADVIEYWRSLYGNLPIVMHRDIDLHGKTDPAGIAIGDIEHYFPKAEPPTLPANASVVYTPATPIVAPARTTVTPADVAAAIAKHGTRYDAVSLNSIAESYWHYSAKAGIDPLIAIAQVLHETGWLTSWWSQRPRRNPAGIGVTGEVRADKAPSVEWAYNPDRRLWERGISFLTWDRAAAAHVGRLLAYACPAGVLTDDQHLLISTALAVRPLSVMKQGQAQTLAGLSGTWAVPGVGYAGKLAAIAQALSTLAQ